MILAKKLRQATRHLRNLADEVINGKCHLRRGKGLNYYISNNITNQNEKGKQLTAFASFLKNATAAFALSSGALAGSAVSIAIFTVLILPFTLPAGTIAPALTLLIASLIGAGIGLAAGGLGAKIVNTGIDKVDNYFNPTKSITKKGDDINYSDFEVLMF